MSLAPDGIGGGYLDTWLGHEHNYEDNYEDNDGKDKRLDNGVVMMVLRRIRMNE